MKSNSYSNYIVIETVYFIDIQFILKKFISSKAFFNLPTTIPTIRNLFVSVSHGRFVTVQKKMRGRPLSKDSIRRSFFVKFDTVCNDDRFIFIEIS